MKIEFIKKLIETVENSNIEELEVRRFGTSVRISKNLRGVLKGTQLNVEEPILKEPEKPPEKKEPEPEKRGDKFHTIRSPMVGTFYRAPAPDAPPYVEEGDHIKKGDVVCIIEAMKIMNEIESDVSGEIAKVLVSNEDPVEYNQELFIVRKS
ncbi:MAG: acetyl-CoA carboxylase biotin carboxyl carrier protein [candidate division WOR-3 bacterium]|nr:acetyl-CoA carboxylase biotin carboxyl carrier protein [candidate division WOR-3 bacterium]